MGKMNDYQNGRMDGLLLAQKIVKEGGLEALDKEIRFRGATNLHTALAVKDLDKTTAQIKEFTLDTLLVMTIAVLYDEFDFEQEQCLQYLNRASKISESLLADMATWSDYQQMIKDELGIELTLGGNE